MAAKHWMWGCGTGCGLVVLIGIALLIAGFQWTRQMMGGFENAIETRQLLEGRFGEAGDFTPWPDGSIPADRLEAFLSVREGSDPARKQFTDVFRALEGSEEAARELENKSAGEKARFGLDMTRKALGLATQLGRFFELRNQALLDNDMGLGEYSYIYVVAFNSWLGHSAGDDTGGRGEPDDRLSRRLSDELLSMLRNQLAGLPEEAPDSWRAALAAEIEALETEPGRVPWKNGLPQATEDSLEPFRERLEAGYDPIANEFELSRNKKENRFSIKAE